MRTNGNLLHFADVQARSFPEVPFGKSRSLNLHKSDRVFPFTLPFWFTFFLVDSPLPGVLKITAQILGWLRVLFGSGFQAMLLCDHSFFLIQPRHPHDWPEEGGSFWGGPCRPGLSARRGSKTICMAQDPEGYFSALWPWTWSLTFLRPRIIFALFRSVNGDDDTYLTRQLS